MLARKQHSLNVMLTASFNKEFRDAYKTIAPFIRANNLPDIQTDDNGNNDLREALRLVLNHYEFVAAGIRNGDMDETLIRDSERGTILTIFEAVQKYIESLRTTRRRRSINEHLEWLHRRWEINPPGRVRRFVENIRGKPFSGQRERVLPQA
jgi:hypothetical protein